MGLVLKNHIIRSERKSQKIFAGISTENSDLSDSANFQISSHREGIIRYAWGCKNRHVWTFEAVHVIDLTRIGGDHLVTLNRGPFQTSRFLPTPLDLFFLGA